MKRCSKCKEVKPLADFYKEKNTNDGHRYECKGCTNQQKKEYRRNNREKIINYRKQYRDANKEKLAQSQKRWRDANSEKLAQYEKQRRETNRKKIKIKRETKKIQKQCPFCLNEFSISPSMSKVFCNKECYQSFIFVTKEKIFIGTCSNCNESFSHFTSRTNQNPKHCCSDECLSEWRKKITALKWKEKEYQEKVKKGSNLKPNKTEQLFGRLLDKYHLPFKYTGDYRLRIDGLNPDFIHSEGRKLLIEIAGDFWHNSEKHPLKEWNARIARLEANGWKTLTIWYNELKNLPEIEIIDKIFKFLGSEQITFNMNPSIEPRLIPKEKYEIIKDLLFNSLNSKEYLIREIYKSMWHINSDDFIISEDEKQLIETLLRIEDINIYFPIFRGAFLSKREMTYYITIFDPIFSVFSDSFPYI